jgi:hypothetical protein
MFRSQVRRTPIGRGCLQIGDFVEQRPGVEVEQVPRRVLAFLVEQYLVGEGVGGPSMTNSMSLETPMTRAMTAASSVLAARSTPRRLSAST